VELTVAIALLPLLHIPPVTASDKASVLPTHTEQVPEVEGHIIGAGAGFTVTTAVEKQP
jgi:hypothetical protein